MSHWCWHTSSADSLIVAIAATNYAIEGATGEWSAVVCSSGLYAAAFPEEDRKRAMKWLKMHAQYDVPTLGKRWKSSAPGGESEQVIANAIAPIVCKSYDYCSCSWSVAQLEHSEKGAGDA